MQVLGTLIISLDFWLQDKSSQEYYINGSGQFQAILKSFGQVHSRFSVLTVII